MCQRNIILEFRVLCLCKYLRAQDLFTNNRNLEGDGSTKNPKQNELVERWNLFPLSPLTFLISKSIKLTSDDQSLGVKLSYHLSSKSPLFFFVENFYVYFVISHCSRI